MDIIYFNIFCLPLCPLNLSIMWVILLSFFLLTLNLITGQSCIFPILEYNHSSPSPFCQTLYSAQTLFWSCHCSSCTRTILNSGLSMSKTWQMSQITGFYLTVCISTHFMCTCLKLRISKLRVHKLCCNLRFFFGYFFPLQKYQIYSLNFMRKLALITWPNIA